MTELRSRGIQPDVIVCRSDRPIPTRLKRRSPSSATCPMEAVVSRDRRRHPLRDPARPPRRGARRLRLPGCCASTTEHGPDLDRRWLGALVAPHRAATTARCASASSASTSNLPDAYLSVVEALRHGGYAVRRQGRRRLDRRPRTSRGSSPRAGSGDLDGIVIPGGFGDRGHRGQDRRRRLRPRARHPVPRPVPRAAGAW